MGRETIDLINKEAEVSEIDASHFNKTDRFPSKQNVMMTEDKRSESSEERNARGLQVARNNSEL